MRSFDPRSFCQAESRTHEGALIACNDSHLLHYIHHSLTVQRRILISLTGLSSLFVPTMPMRFTTPILHASNKHSQE